jgi:hypothetical protein
LIPDEVTVSNRNEYQESSWGDKWRPGCKADNLTAICEPIVQKMWDPRRLTTLWTFTACYRDNFTFLHKKGSRKGVLVQQLTSVLRGEMDDVDMGFSGFI